MNQFTIVNENKRSAWSHEHVTIVLSKGRVWALSRDLARSVNDHYRQVGAVVTDSQGSLVALWGDSVEFRLVATWLAARGYRVLGATVVESFRLVDYSPRRDGYCFRLSDPNTIRDSLGLPSVKRRKSLDLGLVAKGAERASMSVEDMRAAILARQ